MSLYTKYRPRDWDSVIGQDRIKTILRNALTHDRVGHAYLFHGSRGTGKTTSARILAKWVNCTDLRDGNPCHKCANCVAFDNSTMLDIIEIDAASNTGVDNIRDLIEKARFEPNQGTYKVYIIDEVHMLSTGAFNALLKTLEEPPAHVKFILATTEVDKVPETIRSRALRFDFRKITEVDIIDRLQFVIQEEKIQAEEAAIKIIAKYARGWLRDALTLLEQNTIDSELSLEHVRMTLSLLEESQIDALIESLKESDVASIMSTIASLRDIHVSARGFFEQVMYRLRDLMIEHLDDGLYHTYQELYEHFESAYTRVRAIPDGMLLIEMTLLKIVKRVGIEGRKQKTESKNEKEVKIEVKKESKIDENIKTGIMMEEMKGPIEQLLPSSEWQKHGSSGFLPPQEWQKQPEQDVSSSSQEQTILSTWQVLGTNHASSTENQEPKTTPSFSYIALLDSLKTTKAALVIDLKTARFELVSPPPWERGNEGDFCLILIFPKNWNYTRVNTNEMKNTIIEALVERFSGNWSVECRLEESKIQASIADDVF